MSKERFHYCMPMEMAEWEFYGKKRSYYGMAGAFRDHKFFKKRSRLLINKIRRRINNIVTNDEILRLRLINDLETLDRAFKEISPSSYNEIDIIGYFFKFIAHFLGWAHMEGKFFRTPIYFQTLKQQEEDMRKCLGLKFQSGVYEVYKKRQLIIQLLSEGDSYPMVASIMGMSVANVKALERRGHIDSQYREEFDDKKKKRD